jgi:hypothetical protein
VSINLKNCFSNHNAHLSFQVCSTATVWRAPVLSRRDLFPVNSAGLTKRFPMSARNTEDLRALKSLSAYYMYSTMESVFRERNHPIAVRPCFTISAAIAVAVRQSSPTISLRVSLFLFESSFAAARISLS